MGCDRPSLTVRFLRSRRQAQLFFCSQKTLSPSDARAKGDGRAAASRCHRNPRTLPRMLQGIDKGDSCYVSVHLLKGAIARNSKLCC